MANQNAKIDSNDRPTLTAVTDDANQFIQNVLVDPTTGALLISVIGGGGFVELVATGTVNGNNKAFAFIQLPSYIVSDGAWYKQTDNNGVTQWSWNAGTLTATMTVPPSSAVFGVA